MLFTLANPLGGLRMIELGRLLQKEFGYNAFHFTAIVENYAP